MVVREPGTPDLDALRTKHARRFKTLADEVTECFVDFPIAGGAYVVELLAPDGPSTNGGKHALQHLRLRSHREGRAAIVAGCVNPVEKHAELRTFEHAFLVHQIRFGTVFEVSEREWEQLLKRLEIVLDLANIAASRVGPPPDVLAEARRSKHRRRTSPAAILAFVVVLLLALLVSILVWQKLHLPGVTHP
ncbi:MAG: hypothetical protein JWP97_482 [Labilithrix sp.]|nr:hypothetical protein [Labilithrix sp.]